MTALHEIRVARGLTARDFANRAGISTTWVERLECGMTPPMWRKLSRIADVLGVTTDQVLGRGATESAPADPRTREDRLLEAEDRELLDAMRKFALDLLGPQIIGKNGGGWRAIARAAWLGDLTRIRDYTLERPALPPGETLPKAPAGWYDGWESKRQRLARGTP